LPPPHPPPHAVQPVGGGEEGEYLRNSPIFVSTLIFICSAANKVVFFASNPIYLKQIKMKNELTAGERLLRRRRRGGPRSAEKRRSSAAYCRRRGGACSPNTWSALSAIFLRVFSTRYKGHFVLCKRRLQMSSLR
jgi:hypothetical protein